jgi:hypothetical protein
MQILIISLKDGPHSYLQQASKAVRIRSTVISKDGVHSTRHLVHTTDGNVVGEWGVRKWIHKMKTIKQKRSNIHIARQSLRMELLNQLGDPEQVKWSHHYWILKKMKVKVLH